MAYCNQTYVTKDVNEMKTGIASCGSEISVMDRGIGLYGGK